MELVLVRHGEPAWGLDDRPQMDPPLTPRGREQAQLVAGRLAARGAHDVWVSPALRAQQTAAPLVERLGKEARTVDDLVEIRLPDWSHLTLMDVARAFQEARKRAPDAWWDGIPGGESFRDFRVRVERAMRGLLAEEGIVPLEGHEDSLFEERGDPKRRVILVAHGGTNTVAMGVLLGFASAPWEWERFALHHAGIVRLRTVPLGGGVVFSLRAHNDCEHLPRELRTR